METAATIDAKSYLIHAIGRHKRRTKTHIIVDGPGGSQSPALAYVSTLATSTRSRNNCDALELTS